MERIKRFFGWLRGWISPAYITMLVAAFVLWYITKLGETYTTDHSVTVIVGGDEFEVDCTIRGKGTNLINYTISSRRSRFDTRKLGYLAKSCSPVALKVSLM